MAHNTLMIGAGIIACRAVAIRLLHQSKFAASRSRVAFLAAWRGPRSHSSGSNLVSLRLTTSCPADQPGAAGVRGHRPRETSDRITPGGHSFRGARDHSVAGLHLTGAPDAARRPPA